MSPARDARSKGPAASRVQTKRVSDPAARGDGVRILVMRLWPRGTKRAAADLWLKGLGTPLDLIRAWKSGRITWGGFSRAYRQYLRTAEARADMQKLADLASRGRVTLLCTCPEETRCHRGILKGILLSALRRA